MTFIHFVLFAIGRCNCGCCAPSHIPSFWMSNIVLLCNMHIQQKFCNDSECPCQICLDSHSPRRGIARRWPANKIWNKCENESHVMYSISRYQIPNICLIPGIRKGRTAPIAPNSHTHTLYPCPVYIFFVGASDHCIRSGDFNRNQTGWGKNHYFAGVFMKTKSVRLPNFSQ